METEEQKELSRHHTAVAWTCYACKLAPGTEMNQAVLDGCDTT